MIRPVGKGSEDRTKDHDRLLDDREALEPWIRQSDRAARCSGNSLGWTIALFIIAMALSCMIAPVIANVPIKYHRQRFNGSFLKENIYRQDAGPEVDAAWEALGANYRPIRVPVEEAEKSGILPGQVQINEAHGGGSRECERLLTLTVQNLLRQSLYYNYDYYRTRGDGAFRNDDFIVRKHVSHCLDILRQQLMCTIDVGILGQVWIHPDHPSPFVDFNTEHVCRNFEDIRMWAERNQLPLPAHGHGADGAPADFLVPPRKDRVLSEVP
ncbi:hypothetical protein BDW67DRAFT_177599 [Aspergillus spinulosporus]